MSEHFHYLLVGGGLTSASAAKAIRSLDSEGSIAILGLEKHLPYDRPPLSKNLLTDPKLTVEDIASVDDKFYAEKHVAAKPGVTAVSIDRAGKTVRGSDGVDYGYDKLLIATGSTPRQLHADGDAIGQVLYLRTFEDGVRLRGELDSAASAVLIGAGYIGIEIAAACIAKKVSAAILEPKTQPWSKFASPAMGSFLTAHFEKQGVKFFFGAGATAVDRSGGGFDVRATDGRTIHGDLVLAGIGVSYNTEVAKASGIELDSAGRIKVDPTLRTADPSIWAAGDIVAYFDELLGKEFSAEHYMNAKWQGETVGRNMAGESTHYARIPYFFSDMGPLHMVLRGNGGEVDRTRIIGDMATEEFIELYPDSSGCLAMAMAIGADDDKLDKLATKFEELIRGKASVEALSVDSFQ